MNTPRVVVTGVGAVTPVGIGVDESWQAILHGVSGAGSITAFDTTEFDVHIACEVKGFDPDQFMDRKVSKHLDRFAQFGIDLDEL